MIRSLDLPVCLALALGAHLAAFAMLPAGGAGGGGAGPDGTGGAPAAIATPDASLSAMVARWQTAPAASAGRAPTEPAAAPPASPPPPPPPAGERPEAPLPMPTAPAAVQPPEPAAAAAPARDTALPPRPPVPAAVPPALEEAVSEPAATALREAPLPSARPADAAPPAVAAPAAPRPAPAPQPEVGGAGAGAGAGSGAAASASGEGAALRERLVARWGAAVRRAVERRKRYPAGTPATGTATVEFSVRPDGELGPLRLVSSSGDAALDAAALAAVRAARLPPAPDGLSEARSFRLPISFTR